MSDQTTNEDVETFRKEIEKPEFRNWLKGTLAQNIVQTTLCKVIERKWKWFIFTLPEEEKTHLDVFMKCLEECHVKCLETDVRVFNCSHELCTTLLTRLVGLCSFPTTFLETEESYARSGSVLLSPLSSLENENKEKVSHWQIMFSTDSCLELYWSLAKLFVSSENDVSNSSIDDLEFADVIKLFKRCKLFSFEGSQNIFRDVDQNLESCSQTQNNTLSNTDTEALLQSFMDLLINFEDTSFYQCSDALIDIKKLMSEDFFDEFSWSEYIHRVKMTLELKMKAVTNHKTSDELANSEKSRVEDMLSHTNTLLQLTEMCSGKPVAISVEESVTLSWDNAVCLEDTESYQIHYKEKETGSHWKIYPENFRETSAILSNLKPGTAYLFRTVIVSGEDRIYSPESDPITTVNSHASELIENAEILEKFSPAIYLLPMVELEQNDELKIRKYLVGDGSKKEHGSNGNANENHLTAGTLSETVCTHEWEKRTILILGAKGNGRNGVVDSIMNYVLNVRCDDCFKFTTTNPRNTSQDEWVKYYIVNPEKGNRLKYQLHVIDVPGFGHKNQQIMRQIHQLLLELSNEGDKCSTSIFHVVEGADAVTSQQKFTMHLILSLFGKDVQSNICTVILSKYDGESRCSTLLAEANLFVGKTFHLCNVHQSSPITLQHNLKVIIQACNELLAFVENVHSCSFKQTLAIVEQRIASEITFLNIESGFNNLPSVIEDLQDQIKEKHQYKRDMNTYANYETEITKTNIVVEELPYGRKDVTTCSVCYFTCHDDCSVPEDKENCGVMDSNGFCKECPKNCKWNLHINTRTIYRHEEVKEQKIDQIMYGNYISAKSQFSLSETAVETQKQRLSYRQKQIDSDISVFENSSQFGNENAIQGYPRMMSTDMVERKERLTRMAKDALDNDVDVVVVVDDDNDDEDNGRSDMKKDLSSLNQCKTS